MGSPDRPITTMRVLSASAGLNALLSGSGYLRPVAGLDPRLSGSESVATVEWLPTIATQSQTPLPGLDPGIHALATAMAQAQERHGWPGQARPRGLVVAIMCDYATDLSEPDSGGLDPRIHALFLQGSVARRGRPGQARPRGSFCLDAFDDDWKSEPDSPALNAAGGGGRW